MPVSRMEYLPYGETWFQEGDENNAPKYNSQELDKETGYYFYNARHYDPEISRFVTPDSVIDGQYDTQGWNRYSYCSGNPIRYKDPTGHSGEDGVDMTDLSDSDANGISDSLDQATGNNWFESGPGTENTDVAQKLQGSNGSESARLSGKEIKEQMINNLEKMDNGWYKTKFGNTEVIIQPSTPDKDTGKTDPIEDRINKMSNNTLKILGDVADKKNLTSIEVSSLWRTNPNSPVHSGKESSAIDLISATDSKGRTANFNNQKGESESDLAKEITSELMSDKRVRQVLSPWQVKYSQAGKSRENYWQKGENWYRNKDTYELEKLHNNHLHFGTN